MEAHNIGKLNARKCNFVRQIVFQFVLVPSPQHMPNSLHRRRMFNQHNPQHTHLLHHSGLKATKQHMLQHLQLLLLNTLIQLVPKW